MMEVVWLIYHSIIVGMLLLIVLNTVGSVWAFPTFRKRERPIKSPPMVSILVPARNEEAVIRECVTSLKAQNYANFECIVLDDRSDDRTAEILEEEGFVEDSRSRFRRLTGTPLPDGWAGKPWACTQLARAAKGEYLLFTDADTVHLPQCVNSVLGCAIDHETDLLSAWPLQVMKSWSERWIIPILYVLAFALFPQWLLTFVQRNPHWFLKLPEFVRSKLGVANGQFMLFTRECYDSFSGHEAVKDSLVEDVALGRLVFSKCGEGRRLMNGDASSLLKCRMYQNFRGVWEGFSKNSRPVFGKDIVSLILIGVVQLTGFVLPFFIWPFAGQWFSLVCIQIGLVVLVRMLLTLRMRSGWVGLFSHPLAYMIAFLIVFNSWRWSLKKQIIWKGRVYKK